MIAHSFIQRAAITLALLTSFGILVHDTKFDKALSFFTATPLVLAVGFIPQLAGEGHNHVEISSGENAGRSLQNGMPRIQPRNKNKKACMPKFVAKGVHAFDGYYMPLGQL